jgi:hypothetical protein
MNAMYPGRLIGDRASIARPRSPDPTQMYYFLKEHGFVVPVRTGVRSGGKISGSSDDGLC